MTNSLFEVTKALPAYSEGDGDRRFEVQSVLLVSDEPDVTRVVNGKREKVVRFRQSEPPAENVPWQWYFVTRAAFDGSTKQFAPSERTSTPFRK